MKKPCLSSEINTKFKVKNIECSLFIYVYIPKRLFNSNTYKFNIPVWIKKTMITFTSIFIHCAQLLPCKLSKSNSYVSPTLSKNFVNWNHKQMQRSSLKNPVNLFWNSKVYKFNEEVLSTFEFYFYLKSYMYFTMSEMRVAIRSKLRQINVF